MWTSRETVEEWRYDRVGVRRVELHWYVPHHDDHCAADRYFLLPRATPTTTSMEASDDSSGTDAHAESSIGFPTHRWTAAMAGGSIRGRRLLFG